MQQPGPGITDLCMSLSRHWWRETSNKVVDFHSLLRAESVFHLVLSYVDQVSKQAARSDRHLEKLLEFHHLQARPWT